jgi:S1-C subfamily serine protease
MNNQRQRLAVLAGLALLAASGGPLRSAAPEPAPAPANGPELVRRVAPAVALILVGEGGGRLQQTGSGVVVRADGVLLTAYHLVRDAREVQVRFPNGEAFDRVELLAADERRDVAALRISAAGLPTLPVVSPDKVELGAPVYVVSHPQGLGWSVSEGVLSALRPADEVAGAGEAYRLLQFTAPVSPGSSGGPLVDAEGRLLGIITRGSSAWGGQNLNFAVPVEAVLGLAQGAGQFAFASGRELEPPQPNRTPRAADAARLSLPEIVQKARTVFVASSSLWFPEDALANELRKRKEFQEWKLLVVSDRRAADLIIQVDRPVFTYDFTYVILDPRTSAILASGKVIAFDGTRAAPMIAKKVIGQMKSFREAAEEKPGEKKEARGEEEK